ncbi:S-layer homology domain-containing protein [Thermoanaerobacterium butyriciformans]|uniref:SLH domain-containing protein n=1 Tax=Thermoanaerobacterium butyriciformans TaxID=1702242 RepID=A0ABS4ND73_9THEO|nr:S-layer homology domain-containing protein [Thermoanaerobacterium butyriciformans]MBP2071619.1 hypothetical protein [Thermoanaerobacterium butyriciformans]
MKNLKKLIAVVLTFTLVFSAMAVGFAGTFSDVSDSAPYASAVARLQSLGLVSGMPDGTYQPDGAVTRAQMIAFVNAAEGLQDAAKLAVGPTKFSDVPASYWASGDINIADPSGYPDGTFKPNNTVTYPEALALILRALGYTADYSWPYGVIAKATNVGITNGVTLSANATITRGQMAMLVNNALDLDINKYVDGAESDTGKKLITKVATPTEYIVLATADQTSDVAAGNVELYDVSAGKEVVKSAGNIDFTPYVGEDVNVYFTSTGTPVLVEENTNNTKTYTDATIKNVTTTGDVYDSDGNATNVSLKNIQYILYNGYLTNWNALKTKTLPASFDVKFIDNNGDKTYDYAVVTGYDYAAKFVTANVVSGAKYIATDNGNYTLVDSSGNAYHYTVTGDVSKLTDIKANDVVYYGKQYDADGNQVGVYLYVVRQTVSGTVQATYNDGSTNYITINGKDYENLTGKTFSAGDTVTLALDKDGNALRYLSGSITTTSNYALVLDSVYGSALTAKVKLLLPDGTTTTYNWDDTLNGSTANRNITANGLVRYELSSDKTVVENVYDTDIPSDGIKINNSVTGATSINTTAKTIAIGSTTYYLNDNTVIYNYNSTDDSYSVVKLADINSISGVLKIAYDQYNNVEAVVLKDASYSSTDTTDVVGFVTKAYKVTTSDSSFTRITAFVNGQSVTYDATKDLGLTITSTSGNAPYTLTVDNNTGKVTNAVPVSSVVTATVYTSNINTVNMTLKAESASNGQLYYQLAPGYEVVHQNSDSTYSLKYVSDITGNPASVTLYLDANGRVAVIKY